MTLEGVNAIVTELAAVQEQDTQDIYVVIEDGALVLERSLGAFSGIEFSNNMPPRRTSTATARADVTAARVAAATTAAPMTAAAVE
ncbi:hypothetical protein Tco_1019439 [Tanacetum coccineum]|uniref:Uncharacterized protein n=1 Tax=Tanacetum coccineum TaxID=301880 RepID=A0ABQ5FXE1_9ASTR